MSDAKKTDQEKLPDLADIIPLRLDGLGPAAKIDLPLCALHCFTDSCYTVPLLDVFDAIIDLGEIDAKENYRLKDAESCYANKALEGFLEFILVVATENTTGDMVKLSTSIEVRPNS
jgi:hypothetical protein